MANDSGLLPESQGASVDGAVSYGEKLLGLSHHTDQPCPTNAEARPRTYSRSSLA